MNEAVEFESSDGLQLRGEIDRPQAPGGALVVCHAHPALGGTMNSPLLLAIRDALVPNSWTVLRFNFRGIEGSEGTSGDGTEEVNDARGAVAFIREREPDVPIAILGWSFGGAVALRAAAVEDAVEECVAVAPAITTKPGVTAGLPPPDELGLTIPVLVVCGANDDQVAPEECRKWAEAAPTAAYEEIPAANHFFWAKYDVLTERVTKFLERLI